MTTRPTSSHRFAVAFATILAGWALEAGSVSESPWLPVQLDHSEEANAFLPNFIRFGSKALIRTQLVELEYVGILEDNGATPHFILAGRDCSECDMNTSIYIHNPDDGDLLRTHSRYSYPGSLFDYLNPESIVQETRFFFGTCLPDQGPLAIWFTRWQNDQGEWKNGVFSAEKRGSTLEKHEFETGGPPLALVESQVAAGRCREVPGRPAHTEP